MILVLIIALTFVGIEVWSRRKFSISTLLRFLWIASLGYLLMDVQIQKSEEVSEPLSVSVFVDRSDSVSLIDERRRRAEDFLREMEAWSQKEKIPLRIFSFGESVRDEVPDKVRWGSFQTYLAPIQESARGAEGAVVILSDGNFQDRSVFERPVYTVQLGKSQERDVWIEPHQPVFTAFLKNRIRLNLSLGHKGFEGQEVRVSLKNVNSETVDEKRVTLESAVTNFELSVFPEKMGEQTLFLEVELQSNELSEINNRSALTIRTVRDKMRILHIGGRPTPDLKAWRYFLTRQPDVDLVSFYILRSIQDDPLARNTELSLIPFPYDELFSTELEKVDLVILQNFDFNLYFQPFYLSNLAAFVRNGGALLMLGGDQSLHRYRGSPLEALFPIRYEGLGDFEAQPDSVSRFTEHPVSRGLENLIRKIKFSGRHRVSQQPEATALMTYQSGIPFLSLRSVGKGRTVVLNTDESWELQMMPSDDVTAFSRLARRLLQYLTFDPEMDPSKIVSGKWNVGKKADVRSSENRPTDWSVQNLNQESKNQTWNSVTEIHPEVPQAGWYLVSANSVPDPVVFETEEKPWLGEWRYLTARDDVLEKIAENSRGKFLSYDERRKLFELTLSGRQILASEQSPWTRENTGMAWIFLISSLFLMSLDFFLRKKAHWDI